MYNPIPSTDPSGGNGGGGVGGTSTTWWSGAKDAGHSSVEYTKISPDSTMEPKKLVVSTGFFSQVAWHIPALISCGGTVVLLYLNFTEYIIGPEIGKTPQDTRNILGALQLAAKAHEITIIASLSNVARQWIQHNLMSDGISLGLVGAENVLSNLSLLSSREFRSAFKHLITTAGRTRDDGMKQHNRQRWKLIILLIFFAFACVLCSLVGPASAVLLIPRFDWFQGYNFEMDLSVVNYPHIFIDPLLGDSKEAVRGNPFMVLTDYWMNWSFQTPPRAQYTHKFTTSGFPSSVTSTSVMGRSLNADADWEGSTQLSGVMTPDIMMAVQYTTEEFDRQRRQGLTATVVSDMAAVEVSTVCRGRQKYPCSDVNHDSADSSEWCYFSVNENSTKGELQSSSQLLLITYHEPYNEELHQGSWRKSPILWMTEGPRTYTNYRFTESIVFVFEQTALENMALAPLIVCSVTATQKSATITTDMGFSILHAEYHNRISYFDGSTTTYGPPHRIIYHEHWLDSLHLNPSNQGVMESNLTLPYPNRSLLNPTSNSNMLEWALRMIFVQRFASDSGYWWASNETEATELETSVGGSYLSVLLGQSNSVSQYTKTNALGKPVMQSYPDDLMPEPLLDYTLSRQPPMKMFYQVYGYRLSSRTGIFGVTVLITHGVVVLVGSLCQFWKRRVIRSWGSIPEYITLSLGSDVSSGEVENTCAGIALNETLNKIVRIREVREGHLELVVGSPGSMTSQPKLVDVTKKYGHMGRRTLRRRKQVK